MGRYSTSPEHLGGNRIGRQLSLLSLMAFGLILSLPLAAPNEAFAAEPQWWTQQKVTCGLPSGTAYNTWVSQGSPCTGGAVAPSGGGGVTPQQQIILNGAQQMMPVLQQGVHDLFYGNPQEEAARQAAAAQAAARAAAEQQRRSNELEQRAEKIKNQLLGGKEGINPSLTLMGVEGGSDLQLMKENQTPFFNRKVPKCSPSQDPNVVDLCGRGEIVDPATIKIDPSIANSGGAGLTKGRPDAAIRSNGVTPQRSTAVPGAAPTSAASQQQNVIKPALYDLKLSDAALAKLVPLLRQPSSGGPIPTANRPAICESLSRQLDEIYQLARRAVLADDVYRRFEPKQATLPVMAGFDRISDNIANEAMKKLFPGMDGQAIKNLLQPNDSDFRAAIYQDRTDRKKIYLAFRGTKTLVDWADGNLPQGAGLGSAYYARAITLVEKLKASAAANGYQLELLGHSLAGGMAGAAGLVNQVKTITFNTSGVSVNSLPKGTDLSTAPKYVSDVVVDGEPLNMRQDHPLWTRGEISMDSAMGAIVLIPAGLANAATTDVINGGKTHYTKQSMQEIGALYSATLPAAIGQRVTLAPGSEDLNSVNPFRLHYMSSVIDAIVARSREIYGQYVFNECGS